MVITAAAMSQTIEKKEKRGKRGKREETRRRREENEIEVSEFDNYAQDNICGYSASASDRFDEGEEQISRRGKTGKQRG